MKNLYFALGLATLLVAASAGRVLTQAPSTSSSTRVAVVNVGLVFSKYDKATALKAQLEATLKPFRDEGEKIKAEAMRYGKAIQENPKLDLKTKESYETYLLSLKRKMEDLDAQARKLVGKQQEEQIVTLYKELAGAVDRYAKSNGIHAVLGYGEQIEGDMFSFPNVSRKMNGMDLGSTTPLYIAPGVDISQAIIDTLNAAHRASPNGLQGTPTSLPKQ